MRNIRTLYKAVLTPACRVARSSPVGQNDQHDRRRDAEQFEGVHEVDERTAHHDRAGVGQADGEPARPDPGGKGDDQRVDPGPDDEECVKQLDREGHTQPSQQTEDDVPRGREYQGEGDAAQRDQRSRRQVDVAGDDREGGADGDDRQRGVLLQQA
jgi:hypothetical protein